MTALAAFYPALVIAVFVQALMGDTLSRPMNATAAARFGPVHGGGAALRRAEKVTSPQVAALLASGV